jgi:hypothetical protein
MMIERVRINETGIQNKTYKRYQMLETITDPVIWCYIMLQITSTLVIGGLGVFSNLIIASFGFSVLQTQLLNIAQGAVTIMVMVGGATFAQSSKQTILVMHVSTERSNKFRRKSTNTYTALDHVRPMTSSLPYFLNRDRSEVQLTE